MLNAGNYKDVIIIDKRGKIIYSDIGNPQYFKVGTEDITGLVLGDLYVDIGPDYPLLKAVREGKATEFFQCDLTTIRGIRLQKSGCAYPIFKKGVAVAAIEFADFLYDKNHIGEIESHADHLFYRSNNTKYILDDIVTGDDTMIALKQKIETYAMTDSNVLIIGETGTGKELVAQALHNSSRRYHRKFISQNCGAIPSGLLEALLFGTTKGSFTGAENKAGLFELAEGGTLFLDEINSLDPQFQIKLLQAVESKKIRRIGSNREISVNVRIVAATNEEPQRLISENRMKPDLFYRLAVINIHLPRLIQRKGDIELLTNYFIDYFNKKMNYHIEPLSSEILDMFRSYDWPGNVRELRNVIEGAFAFSENNKITAEEIPRHIVDCAQSKRREVNSASASKVFSSLTAQMEFMERAIIEEIYRDSGYNLTAAAHCLGMSKQLLRYKLSKYGL